MRSLVRRTLILSSCAVVAAVASGCEAKKVTEYVPGISTQVVVPRDIKAIRVQINVEGALTFCQSYKAYEGKVLLPRSLGDYAASEATLGHPVSYIIAGVSSDDLTADFFATCSAAKVGTQNLRVLRRSTQPFQQDEILFLPMPLKYSCFDKDCPEDQTCKGGVCVPAALTPAQIAQLVPYSQDLIDGTGGTCFHAKECVVGDPAKGLQAALPAVEVDADKCIYAVAGTKSAPALVPGAPNPVPPNAPAGDGVNVQISYDGGLVHEVLDLDPDEGFFIPDPNGNPQRFQLAPGLCQLVHGVDGTGQPTSHRITSLFASPTCRAKTISQPFCADDQLAAMGLDPQGVAPNLTSLCSTTELKPPQAGLMVVVDDTTDNSTFFSSLEKSAANNSTIDPNDADSAISSAVKAALSDPAFERTDVGLVYAPGDNKCNAAAPEKALAPATTQRDVILNDLVHHPPTKTAPPQIGAALERAYAPLQAGGNPYFRRAVLLLTSTKDFSGDAVCSAPSKGALTAAQDAANASSSVRTYVMQLTKAPTKPTGDWPLSDLAAKGGSQVAAYQSQEGSTKFEEIVNYLATCVYEVPTAQAPKQGDSVAFTSPLNGQSTSLSFNASCAAPDAGSGAGFGIGAAPTGKPNTTGVYLCPDSCTAYRSLLDQTTKFTALYQQPPLPVPVYGYHSPDPTGACPATGP